jgi:FAD/FMN-containing dehydrogenase
MVRRAPPEDSSLQASGPAEIRTHMSLSAPPGFRGVFRADDEARAVYSEAAGIARVMPWAVAVPADEEDVSVLVSWAASTATSLVPRGSGSSMAGGAIGDGVIVDLSRLRRMGRIDVGSRTIHVGPGIRRGEVDRLARASGLRFPVDPSSGEFCTIGGMAATNAAGARSLRFGAMRRWVVALDCVFADGSRGEVRRGAPPPDVSAIHGFLTQVAPALISAERDRPSIHPGVVKESSGYATNAYAESGELVDLLVGSEGTLAMFVGVELALGELPGATSSVLGAFQSLEEAVVAATRARDAGVVACELLERTFLDVAALGGRALTVPSNTQAVLLAEVESVDSAGAGQLARRVESMFSGAGAIAVRVALDAGTETELWELRHAASPILSRLDPALRSMQFIEDTAVPLDRVPDYVRGVRDALARTATRGVIFGHAGDGHVHVNPLVDVSQADWRRRVTQMLDDVTGLARTLGGTLAGEHGDGRLRTPLLDRVWPSESLERFATVKAAFDPRGILNPGVKVPDANQDPLGSIKYDPQLPALPPRARAALDVVDRSRAYDRFRLDLLAPS